MLDTIFWAAVIVAILCGVFIICVELYDEWADEARYVDSVADETSAA